MLKLAERTSGRNVTAGREVDRQKDVRPDRSKKVHLKATGSFISFRLT